MAESPNEVDARNYASAIGSHRGPDISAAKLLEIYELFGGVELFKRKGLGYEWNYLRHVLLASPNFPVDTFVEIVNSVQKFTRDDIQNLAQHPHAVADWDIFEKLWAVHRDSFLQGLLGAETTAIVTDPNWGNSSLTLPTVHDERCLNGEGRDHYWCFTSRLTYGDKLHAFYVEFQSKFQARFHPTALATIQNEALTLTEYSKERYAGSTLVADDQWHLLLVGKRPILNAAASNRLLPVDYAYEIIREHKSPGLRVDIVRNAASKELLDFIWDGTKSEDIRRAIVGNPTSGRYLTNPEFLMRY